VLSKQVKGRDFFWVLMYNQKKIIAGVGAILDSNINMGTVIQQANEFTLIRQLKPNLSKAVYHVSLNLPYTDKLTDEEFSNLARDYLEGMGFNDNQFIIYRHFDMEHSHIHIVANRVKYSGEVVSDSQDYKRSEALVRKLEVKYNLTQFIAKKESNVLSKGEIEKCLRTGNVPERLELQNIIFEILNQNNSLEEFIKKLKQNGVKAKLNKSSTTGYISGISFEFKGVNYKGSGVHKNASWNNIKTKIRNYEQDRNHSIVPENTTGIRPNKKNTIRIEKANIEVPRSISRQSDNIRKEIRQDNNELKNKPKFKFR
jgi:hypothetical protein